MIVDAHAAAACLRAGEVVAYPTETVYGLAVDVGNAAAVARLRALKGRDGAKAISVLLATRADLERYEPPACATALAEAFWPGPLTLVFSTDEPGVAALSTPDGVGFRCSPHPGACELARVFGGPVASTSANPTGQPPAASADGVAVYFGVEFPILGGEAGGAEASTVVACGRDGAVRILREGAVPAAALGDWTRAAVRRRGGRS